MAVVATQDEPEDDEDDLSIELRGIFVEEMQSLRDELDDEVAQLTTLPEMAPPMANIMRNLHTIKGSALMAEANVLGKLTHQVETYLESTFIRDDNGLKDVKQTLEMFVDAADSATKAYESRNRFEVPSDIANKLGVDFTDVDGIAKPAFEAPSEPELVVDLDGEVDEQLDATDIAEALSSIVIDVEKLHNSWSSANAWEKVQPELDVQYSKIERLVDSSDELDDIAPLLNATQAYIASLTLKDESQHKKSKALLEETFDVVVANSNALANGENVEPVDTLIEQLSTENKVSQENESNVSEPNNDSVAVEDADPMASATKVEASVFVPGTTIATSEVSDNAQRKEKGGRDRSVALRIKTETLDSLTNFVGDVSMNRSQMREDVLSVKSVVDELYNNVQRFSTQLRELEIEADSKISSRTNESISNDRGDEFDPLELDRYTKLQQLSRGLTENLDELNTIQGQLSSFVYKAENSLQKQERLNRELQDEIMQVRLVTFGGIGPQLRQVVRKTARELGKDVDVELIGADVKLDKTILDGVVPAIEHMLRNAVDHGIEDPSTREKSKKSKTSKVTLECRQVSREIMISVRDDGAGLDLEKIRLKAVENGLLTEDQEINPQDIMIYISQSGFSTAESLTEISGRGVGMDVVQSTIRRMSGSISYDMENDQPGSHFIIRLPISLAVSSAMFIKAGTEQFAISSRTIERVVNIDVEELINNLKADNASLDVGGTPYSLIDLADYLGYDSKLPTLSGKLSVILVNSGVQNIAVIVEELMDTQEIVVKNLGEHLGRIPIYAGATIRGNGKVVLLLDLVGISYYESFVAIPEQNENVDLTHVVPTVMVVDDSLTVRKSAERDITGLGINTVLAKNGLDAQLQLKQDAPDMILLDIEMPQMDGFELLEWVKSTEQLKHIPVVMISSRATEKYINKATELGCSGFLGKPYLLESLVESFNKHLTLDAPISLDDK